LSIRIMQVLLQILQQLILGERKMSTANSSAAYDLWCLLPFLYRAAFSDGQRAGPKYPAGAALIAGQGRGGEDQRADQSRHGQGESEGHQDRSAEARDRPPAKDRPAIGQGRDGLCHCEAPRHRPAYGGKVRDLGGPFRMNNCLRHFYSISACGQPTIEPPERRDGDLPWRTLLHVVKSKF
jgi:hypothetical protein